MKPLHVVTPVIESTLISQRVGARVFLKLDNAQQTGSFKIRGIGNICKNAVTKRGCTHLISSSGGNAGLAVAYAARKLNVLATIVVPTTTSPFMREKMSAEGAKVLVDGDVWAKAHEKATQLAQTTPNSELIHPFDHPEIWDGHASIIEETIPLLPFTEPPAAVICVVGGGGLLCGILEGMHRVGWNEVPVLACETKGANKFEKAVREGELVTINEITSIAKTLGANRVTAKAFEWTKHHKIINCIFSDKEVLSAVLEFQRDHQALVEPSCAAGIAVVYDKEKKYLSQVLKKREEGQQQENILVIVCGGSMVNFDLIEQWKIQVKDKNE